MTDERWQKVKAIFHEASDRPAATRPAYLDQACAGDAELRREVETLLAADEPEDGFLEQPLLPRAQNQTAPTGALNAGQMISHYQIERRLGAGGMGVVYLARDTRLGRPVALKLLRASLTQDPARVRRFRQEARAASALNHPNIITIYDVGQADAEMGGEQFIAAEFVDGRTLREHYRQGPMTLSAALDVLIQTTAALAAAHEAGIIHRDIKPENIMLRPDGIVKVLDFGLAKLTESSMRPLNHSAAHVTTQPGIVMGTVSYMSPEQARGLTVDSRSDLFSLGVVIYELLTGHAPFEGETTADVLAAVLSGEPRPLTRYTEHLPIALQEITSRALAKPAEQRYQTALKIGDDLKRLKEELRFSAKLRGSSASRDDILAMPVGARNSSDAGQTTFATRAVNKLATPIPATSGRNGRGAASGQRQPRGKRTTKAALTGLLLAIIAVAGAIWGWRWFASRAGAIDSIAVLPFANVGNDPQMEYLPDGITESLINSLSPALRVMARSTVFTYKGREVDPRQVGAALKVRAVVTGRVQHQGERLLIRVELADAANGARLWHADYQRHFSDLLTVQEEIVREISLALRLHLSGAERRQLGKRYTENAEAYQLYLKGLHLHRQYSQASMEKARGFFEQAIALDPRYALAYTGLADVYADLSSQYLPPAEAMPKSRQAALTALTLDETLAEAHHSLALVKLWGDWDWAGAEREFRQAIELNPNSPITRIYFASCLSEQGRFEEALREARKAEELDPLSAQAGHAVSRVFFAARQYDRTIEQCRKTIELNPDYYVEHIHLARALIEKRIYQEAGDELRRALALNPQYTQRSWLAYYYAVSGQPIEARKVLHELDQLAAQEWVSPITLARIHVGLGENDRAFALLRKAYEEHSDHLLNLLDPAFDPLRADPRFATLLRGVGLRP